MKVQTIFWMCQEQESKKYFKIYLQNYFFKVKYFSTEYIEKVILVLLVK